MKSQNIFTLILIVLISGACSYSPDPENPGFEFAPNMYHPISYQALKNYADEPHEFNPHGMNMRAPAEGTIARGNLDYYYPYPNNNEGYEQAGEELTNPIPLSEETLAEGKRLYHIYCAICHGNEGLGDGNVISKQMDDGLFPAPPAYNSEALRELPEGKMYHSITYGRNLMGSHASQLTPEQRWKIIHYVQTLQAVDIKHEPEGEVITEDDEVDFEEEVEDIEIGEEENDEAEALDEENDETENNEVNS